MSSRLIYWTPRILSILFIAFLAMFSLDVIEPGKSIWEIVAGLFMHNIPVFILIAALIIAWKKELVGAVAYFLVGILYILFALHGAPNIFMVLSWSMIIAGPAFIIGILFFIGWKTKNNYEK